MVELLVKLGSLILSCVSCCDLMSLVLVELRSVCVCEEEEEEDSLSLTLGHVLLYMSFEFKLSHVTVRRTSFTRTRS